ncbi:MAG: transcription antitermination factor NusB [Planctomycetes bacterium]|nr:transcription antitermination factor NusB [Planctomycetota bacterium]
MRPRTVGRRLALQYLFMADMNRFSDIEMPEEFFRTQRTAILDEERGGGDEDIFGSDYSQRGGAEEFALSLIHEVEQNIESIDAAIEKAAQNWSIARMGVIERNVIRLAAAELRFGASPRGVIIDEAVELAKRFGDKESGAFVNGIADKLQ